MRSTWASVNPSSPSGRLLLEREEIDRIVERLGSAILERIRDVEGLVLVGIRRGGVPLTKALARQIERETGKRPTEGTLDINLYRDDVALARAVPKVGPSQIPTELEGKEVVLVDDVLHTGRTVRAAIDALHDYGRPARTWLAVLCDRGGRELPIAADFVGKTFEVERGQKLEVEFDDAGPTGARLTLPPTTP
jgi:pyrimidine operon attenuation protein / uracil phosphoribosyltransferase